MVRGPIVLPSLAHFRCAGLQRGSLPARTFGKRGYLILDLYQRLWPDTLRLYSHPTLDHLATRVEQLSQNAYSD